MAAGIVVSFKMRRKTADFMRHCLSVPGCVDPGFLLWVRHGFKISRTRARLELGFDPAKLRRLRTVFLDLAGSADYRTGCALARLARDVEVELGRSIIEHIARSVPA